MNGTIRYTVRPFDTFWMLAQVFNTTVDSIIELNPGVDPRNLQVGHVITIRPGYQYYPPYPVDNNMMDDNGMMDNGMMNNGMMNNGMMNNGMMNNGMMNNGMMNNGMMNNSMMNNSMMNNGMMNDGMMNDGMMNDDMMDYEMGGMLPDLTEYFHMLWGQHVMWTRIVMAGIIYDLPELEFTILRLLRNATDFANALRPFYGDEVAQSFENLFREHITIASELITAAKAGDTNQVDTVWQRWVDNANQIAEFLGSINPNWSVEDWNAMFMEHLELLGNNLSNMLEQNFQVAVDEFDDIESQAMEMADMMAEGIAIQFPE